MDRPHRTGTARLNQQGPHHIPALIDLGDHRLGPFTLDDRRDHPGPGCGRQAAHRLIGQHIGCAIPAPRNHNPAGIAVGRRGRVHRHHHPVQFDRTRASGPRQILGAEQGPVGLNDLPLQLLRLQPCPGIEASQMPQKPRGQIVRVDLCPRPTDLDPRLGQQPPQRHHRARRGRDHQSRIGPPPQRKPQCAQRPLGIAPGTELVDPGRVKLRPAQRVRVLG